MKIKFLTLVALVLSAAIYGQNLDVSGTVTEASTGQPLPGVNVILKNTSKGASTDFDGNFTLYDVPVNSIVVISYLGFITQEITIVNNQPLNILLKEDTQSLDEVVVIGYGTQTKKEVTGAVSVVDSDAIEKLNPVRVEQALQGQVAGVTVTSNSGSPGAGSNIRIRGISTNGDARPLILVDGNVIEDLSVINPSDIESINVLKDATAGIYGVRAANGVVLITTKSGKKNTDLKFQLDSYLGFQTTSQKIDLLNATDFAIYVNDAADQTEFFVYPQKGTDWQDEVFETAPISNINLSANGGTEKSAYSFGISYLDQDGIVGLSKSNYSRLTARFNYSYDILDNLKVTATGLHTISEKNNLAEGGIGAVLYNAVNVNPNLSVRDEDGMYSLVEDLTAIEISNPLAQIKNTYNTTRVSKVAATLGLDYTFLDNFKFSSKFQINHANVRDDIFRPEVNYGPGKSLNVSGNEVVDNGADFDDYTWDNYLTYTKTFKEDHNLTVLVGTSIFKTKGLFYGITGIVSTNTNSFGDSVYDLDGIETGVLVPRFRDDQIALGQNVFDDRLGSIFGRLQYNYKGKYLLSAALRRDGSSKFGPENRYGIFPTGSIGWNVSDEPFLRESTWLNSLKLRGSFGIIGNDRIPPFGFTSLLTGEATYAPGTETSQEDLLNGTAIGLIGNPNLKWEEQVAQNIGFDASFFERKLSLSLDLFSRKTEDLLIAPQASGLIGAAAPGSFLPFVNAGTVENKGIEISVGYSNWVSEDFEYNVGFNMTTLDNKVVSLNGNIPPVGGEFGVGISQTGISRMIPGLPLGHFYGYKTNGIYQTQAEIDALNAASPEGTYHEGAAPGDLKFVDINGDGEITADDRTNIGDPIAELTMGFNFGFKYKNIDFSATAFASIGNDMVRDYERKNLYANRGTYMLDRWQGSGTSNSVPRAVGGASINTDLFSDFYVEDASFVRLQNVQIGYTFNQDKMKSIGVDKLRIYLSGNNLFTITDYLGYDPSASNGAPIGSGIDKGFYPVARTYLLGINLNF